MSAKDEIKKFRIVLSDPTFVYQGAAGDTAWGHYQFPNLSYTTKGAIVAHWSYHNDTVLCDGHSATAVTSAVSDDGGKTWRAKTAEDIRKVDALVMDNGKCLIGFRGKPGYKADFLDKYTPAATGIFRVYFAEDLLGAAPLEVKGIEVDPETGETDVFPVQLNWPYRPLNAFPGNILVPTEYMMQICAGYGLLKLDDGLYYCVYSAGFDSNAFSRESAVLPYSGNYHIYVFKSTDNGRTWNFLSQIYTDETIYEQECEGLCEPMMRQMPDGSVVILMRTGGGGPNGHGFRSYIARSTDNCKTWSKPEVFDRVGVLPQLLPLKCGVSIATYGRPGLYLKATGDPHGVQWEEPIEIPLSAGPEWRSCYYTNLLALDDRSALLIYTDFHHPLPSGEGEGKAVLVRTITVEEE